MSSAADPSSARSRNAGAARPTSAAGASPVGLSDSASATTPIPASASTPPPSPRISRNQMPNPTTATTSAAIPNVNPGPVYSRRCWGRSSGKLSAIGCRRPGA